MAKRNGLTLVELMVALALAALLGTLCVQFLTRLLHLSARATQRGQLQSEGMVVLRSLEADLQQTLAARIVQTSLPPNGVAVGFPRLSAISGQGRLEWDESYVIYRCEDDHLVRRRGGGADSARPAPLTPLQLVNFPTNNQDRRLSTCLRKLQVEVLPGPSAHLALDLQVERETLRLTSTVGMRNL